MSDEVVYDHVGISKTRVPGGDWKYSVFRVGELEGDMITSAIGVGLDEDRVELAVREGFGTEGRPMTKRKTVVPYDRCLNGGERRGIHLERERAADTIQVGVISDDELAELVGFDHNNT
jgi:hypothetical protein